MKLLFSLLIFLLLFGCASKPQTYYFDCHDQVPEIVFTYFPQALTSIGYDVLKIDRSTSTFQATKPIRMTNKEKGIEYESIQIIVKFHFDQKKSEITQYYVNEYNGKKKTSALSKDQILIHEKDALKLLEKTLFYCNPEFKGR